MKEFHLYQSLCTEVYELVRAAPPGEAYAFYRDYVEAAQNLVLEPMCGSGRFLLPFLE